MFSCAVLGLTIHFVPFLRGLAAGAEIDVVTFIASRSFDPRNFGSIYAVIISMFGFAASLGPLLAAGLYDLYGSYDFFLVASAALSCAGAAAIAKAAGDGTTRFTTAEDRAPRI